MLRGRESETPRLQRSRFPVTYPGELTVSLQETNSNSAKQQVELESRLEELRKENDKLRQQLNLLEGIYDLHATKIAAKAQYGVQSG